jgi:oligopeptide/dipeptide ABC transporter ATP-binding protein
MTAPLLEARGWSAGFTVAGERVPVVRDVSFVLRAGETLALVGESGCGKSVTALSLVGLLPPGGHLLGGEIRIRGAHGAHGAAGSAIGPDPRELRRVRGRHVAMIFQDPSSALNPVRTVGRQLRDVVEHHTALRGAAARAEVVRLLDRVGLRDPERTGATHPHALSGGERQRVMIALALSARPAVLLADEPTTALDVTVQARIAALIRDVQDETGMAVLWITHDLALAVQVADRVAVMYAGRIVEEAPVEKLRVGARHPYTRRLLAAARELDAGCPRGRLTTIPGRPPAFPEVPQNACAFAPRCPRASARCGQVRPELVPGQVDASSPATGGHRVACWHPGAPPRGSTP